MVKVEIQSVEALMQKRQEVKQKKMPELSSGEFPERIRQALEAGLITQQQAKEMMRRIQEGETPLLPGGRQGDKTIPQEGGQWPTITPENLQHREGLTVIVSIILEERNDVLLVPNSAITSSGGQTYVKMLSPDGIIEDRLVIIGISDWQYTEIVEGLSEGEKVVVSETTTTPTTQQEKPGGMFVPGRGGFGK